MPLWLIRHCRKVISVRETTETCLKDIGLFFISNALNAAARFFTWNAFPMRTAGKSPGSWHTHGAERGQCRLKYRTLTDKITLRRQKFSMIVRKPAPL